ncbi:YebC/PmpR family DNA-binding transcriptional regulator [Xylocopilactobacillus apis]|uniref:Probable transcriptional regulatory protein KIMC2_09450 n=1 Tax=Xylocopilactobacillus apis TaxID=2932183 RepID=A0AAU9CYR6_9LACO|nr:YebC/PmpR family DNA-binding transcriptional regulator [Xylocopilactobacillus apis]BDR56383.1 putative transcriptional regulatory protein [Xylocopilactobacillus apis]
MSGHSKWHNIQGRKNAQDAKRGKIFQKISKELYVAAKSGGPDPSSNANLRLVMEKAKQANMPKDNIKRAIDKASGVGGANYEEVVYEGYGPGGIAVLVYTLTDNKNRTATQVRMAFSRNGGTMGEAGSVSYMFERKGEIIIPKEDQDIDEDQLTLDALDAGADDIINEDDFYTIYTSPKSLNDVKEGLEKSGYVISNAEVSMIPNVTTKVPEDKEEKFEHMLDALDDSDDVSSVYTAAE